MGDQLLQGANGRASEQRRKDLKRRDLGNLKKDLQHYSRFCCGGKPVWRVLLRILYAHPAAAAVIWYRFGSTAWRCRVPVLRQLLQFLYLLGLPFVRTYAGAQIQPQTKIGPGLIILHFGGVVITRECEIGENCVLYHNVSIITAKRRWGPRIGSDFYAGVGATVIGDVTIENHVTCGAGAIVTRSVPEGAIVAGVPAKIIRFRGPKDHHTENLSAPWRPAKKMEIPSESEVGHETEWPVEDPAENEAESK